MSSTQGLALAKEESNKPLHPPQLSLILRDNNVLQPEKWQLDEALEKSRKYWYQLASVAYELRDSGLTREFINPRHALHGVPRFRTRAKELVERPFVHSPHFSLCMYATAVWKLSAEPECGVLKNEISRLAILQVGAPTVTPFTFAGKAFSSWNGIADEKNAGPNYLGILTVGWCYILSAQLVEIQGEGASMKYTNLEAEDKDESQPHSSLHFIDIGEVDEDVTRWWSAILAPREGWKATIKDFLSPWAVSRTCETRFSTNRGFSPTSTFTPLSSERAFEVLAGFARLHGLDSQFPIALAMALTIPTYKYYKSTAQLPPPSSTGGKKTDTPIDAVSSGWANLKEDLPYYMTLSCSPEVIMSTLCGAFWEADVPCNLVSPWLHPALNEVPGAMTGSEQEVIALMGAIRQPNFSAFWIGAVATGLGPEILHWTRRGRPLLNPLAFPWTGCAQCFMDIPGSGPYTCENPEYILRADAWRLMHLPSSEEDNEPYEHRPFTPWIPCGASLTKDSSLRVRSHLECSRHEYRYDHWVWSLEDGSTTEDHGCSKPPTLSLPESIFDIKTQRNFKRTEVDQEASEDASADIFRWFYNTGEGVPLEKIYQDYWLEPIWQETDEGEGSMDDEAEKQDSQGKVDNNRLESWLNTVD